MSQDYHHNQQGLFSFTDQQDETQIRRDNHKLRIQGFEHHPLVGISHAPEGASSGSMHPAVYETAGMLSEMLNFGGGPAAGDSTAGSMQFFLSDPQPRAPSPPPQHHQFTWVPGVENRGLSLSLSSSLEAAKAEEELRSGGGMMFFGNQETQNQHVLQLQGYGLGQHSGHFGFGSTPPNATSPIGAVNVLRNSKYTKATQELLEEFCSVGRGHLKKNNFSRNNSMSSSTTSAASGSGGVGPSSSNSAKDLPPLSPADRMEHQRRKVKLLSMLDEVERRYSHYCEQMQMVVNSYDVVMGYGAAIPYTALAQKAMSRHFRCLKDAIQAQLKHSCELLGEKDVSSSTGLTKGETPRLKVLEQSLRQQRAFHQMGIMDQEAWRPQRGLPERSVNILRAWLFEHFLHPYPSDADKHLLARQTGLSRNQVSNWFINARVRLWKPMVEEMYQQESKDGEDDDDDHEEDEQRQDNEERESAQTSMHLVSATTTTLATATETLATNKRSQINVSENDPSLFAINGNTNLNRQFSGGAELEPEVNAGVWPAISHFDDFGTTTVGGRQHQRHDEDGVGGPTVIRFGTAGDVSLTLGLRHSSTGGNPPEKSGFSFRDFGN